ncbi:MAG: cyclase family protein [Chloroflexia bacterium]|nr:cyclase family protein [Chloroflexia bacterium]
MIPADATVIDVSLPISPDLCVWPGDAAIEVTAASRISTGAAANVSRLDCTSHTGTHVDAPWHFVDHGKRLEDIALERWIGPCFVAEIDARVTRIDAGHLESAGIPPGTDRVILKTANSRLWKTGKLTFETGYVGLSPDAARWVVDHGVRLIGIDYLSIEPYQEPGHQTHLTLLENEVLILEGLNLTDVAPGVYDLVCLPLRLTAGDGAPARALLIRR